MTGSVAGKLVEKDKDKEKAGIRKALGRGLESLLPGPRAVVRPAAPGPGGSPAGAADNSAPGASVAGPDLRAVVEGGEAAVPTPTSSASAQPLSQVEGVASEPISFQAMAEGRVPANLIVNIELDSIEKNPYQTRYDFDDEALEELADSIRVQGIVQPVVVRPSENEGKYILILGERRCRASKMAGKTTVPAIVKRVSTQQAAEMTIIENLQRQELNCIEQAEAFRVLSTEFGLTQSQIGARIGMSRESVANYMRLLKLPQAAMEHLLAGRLSFSDARELLKLEDPVRIELAAEKAVKEHMKWEEIETMVARMTGWLDPVPGLPGEEKKPSTARWVDPNVRAAQTDLERLLQVRVRIKDRKGKGKIVIEYSTVDDYERVVGMLRGKG